MCTDFAIGRAEPRDIPDIVALTNAAYAPWVDVIGRKPLPMTADYEVAVKEHLIDLMHKQGRLIGLIEMIVEPSCLLIENVAVSPDHQKQGVGTALLRHAEKQALRLGLAGLRLYTNQKFHSNIAFYEGLGFETERIEPFKSGWTVYMNKSLKEDPKCLP